jgi:hypothetical protein
VEDSKKKYRKLHKKELHNLHTTTNIMSMTISTMRWSGNVACTEQMRSAYKFVVVKLETTWKT